jgi:hypothetical protein
MLNPLVDALRPKVVMLPNGDMNIAGTIIEKPEPKPAVKTRTFQEAGVEVHRRAQRAGGDYRAAVLAVLKADAQLAREYVEKGR